MKNLFIALFMLSALALSSSPLNNEADVILGKWWNHEKDAHIEIYKCGDELCGKIVWLKFPLDDDGKPKHDKNNPDESLRSRPTLGLDILSGFEYTGDKTWEDGTIYNPRDGKTYSCYLNLLEEDKLKVRGFVGISLIGKTQYWERVDQ